MQAVSAHLNFLSGNMSRTSGLHVKKEHFNLYTHTHIHMHMHTQACTNAHTNTYTLRTHAHTYMHTHSCTHTTHRQTDRQTDRQTYTHTPPNTPFLSGISHLVYSNNPHRTEIKPIQQLVRDIHSHSSWRGSVEVAESWVH